MMTTEQKLARIARRSTLYEAVIVHPGTGERKLLCYSSRSRAALHRYAWAHRDALRPYLAAGWWLDGFSGRTQREAYIAGELPWFGDAAAEGR